MITLSRAQVRLLAEHSEREWPRESCALLIGRRNSIFHANVSRIEISPNISDRPDIRFEIDPGLRIGLERELRDQRQEIIGVFHSHPQGPAYPSDADAQRVYEKQLIWLIGDLSEGQWLNMNAFRPDDGYGFDQIALSVK